MPKSGHEQPKTVQAITARNALEALLRQKKGAECAPPERQHVRKPWTVDLQIRIEERVSLGKIKRDLRVTTQDLSRGGYSFRCKHFLHNGTVVRARIPSLSGNPELIGSVVNCTYTGDGQHRVGVKFRSADA